MHIVLTVRLPDRPGALGAVASRVGGLGANITDISIADRANGTVDDVFHLTLPTGTEVDLVELLRGELSEVDGVVIQGWYTGNCCS
jgi:ACT domain-containing protein